MKVFKGMAAGMLLTSSLATAQTSPDAGGASPLTLTSPPGDALLTGDLSESLVINRRGEEIGKVEQLLISRDGRVLGVVVSVGGFMGIAQKHVAIAWDRISLEPAESGEGYVVRVDVDRGSLEAAPGLQSDREGSGDDG
jgi:sporulation protein YlmC with PRC-barrel domain